MDPQPGGVGAGQGGPEGHDGQDPEPGLAPPAALQRPNWVNASAGELQEDRLKCRIGIRVRICQLKHMKGSCCI